MNGLTAVCLCVLVVLTAIGIHKVHSWLERWDYDRHFHQ
jgi:hypothetical protein